MEVVRLRRDQMGAASDLLARSFHDDPAWVWLIPDADRRRSLLPWLFRVGFEVTAADVYGAVEPVTAPDPIGVARWLPPGRPAMHVGATLKALVTTPFRLGATTGSFLAYGKAVEELRSKVAPGAHWYLAGIGVDPGSQRQGVGAALLQPGIAGAEAARLPTVLLTNNEANLSFYSGHGFSVVREGRTPTDGPMAWAMVRSP
ncbi:MAG: GNAT family N-acetyltransferase [Actinobacteria bacterium]|nr:GNAT family N-acetyltransferase [Actinomycetota bacterium]